MTQLDIIRERVQRRIEELGLDYATVSRRIGRNHAYIQQYLKRNNPAKLPEEARGRLAEVLAIDESELKPGPALMKALTEARANTPAKDGPARPAEKPIGAMVAVAELDVRAYAGAGADLDDFPEITHQWQMPREVVQGQTTAGARNLRIITVYGDSNEPTLMPGQRVLVDTSDRTPSPPGFFICWDGLGIVVKRVEVVAHSDPLRVRLMSDNPRYSPYERTLDEAHINGRVIGRWTWS